MFFLQIDPTPSPSPIVVNVELAPLGLDTDVYKLIAYLIYFVFFHGSMLLITSLFSRGGR
jgi:hypothetical protein